MIPLERKYTSNFQHLLSNKHISLLPQIFATGSVHLAFITHGPEPGGSFVGRDDTSRGVGDCSEMCDDVLEVDGLER